MPKLRTINPDKIKEMVNDRLITVFKHPFLDLYICNYTIRTQYDRLWDQYTKICRGLIIDNDCNILNNPFPKFFNLGENEEMMIHNLPAEIPSITEKLDGMLGILYREGDNPAIATRGRFDSPYAEWATNWLRLKGYCMEDFKPDYTYLFEIIYPGNKIVVDYGDRAELALIAVRNNYNDSELNHIKEAEELGFSYAKEFSPDSISGADKINGALKYLEKFKGTEYEGFVCKYSNGLRVKIKSLDYRRLSKILTGISAKDIWSSLKYGTLEQIIDNVPDELYGWIKNIEKELIASKMKIMRDALFVALEAKKLESRVKQADYIINRTNDVKGLRGVIFFLLDNRTDEAENAAWKLIEPSGDISWKNKGNIKNLLR